MVSTVTSVFSAKRSCDPLGLHRVARMLIAFDCVSPSTISRQKRCCRGVSFNALAIRATQSR